VVALEVSAGAGPISALLGDVAEEVTTIPGGSVPTFAFKMP
jgi:protein-L-isoaspartate O-methyltransferase